MLHRSSGAHPNCPVQIADIVDQDHVFCLLYKELYFRSVQNTACTPTPSFSFAPFSGCLSYAAQASACTRARMYKHNVQPCNWSSSACTQLAEPLVVSSQLSLSAHNSICLM